MTTRTPAGTTKKRRNEFKLRLKDAQELYRDRLESLEKLHAFAIMLRDDHDGFARAAVLSEMAGDRWRTPVAAEIVSLRASIDRVSPVLLAACGSEGLQIASVAFALRPFAHWPDPDAGWPWTHGGEDPPRRAVDAGSFLRIDYDRHLASAAFVRRNRDNGAFMRGLEHSSGGWAASVRRGVLGTEMIREGATVRTVGDRGILAIAAELPPSAACAVRGRPVSDVIDHPALQDPCLVMTSARVESGLTTVRFRCPPVAAGFSCLTVEPSVLRHACEVVLGKELILMTLLASELEGEGEGSSPAVMRERLIARVCGFLPGKLAIPQNLPIPTKAWVEDAMRPERRDLLEIVARTQ